MNAPLRDEIFMVALLTVLCKSEGLTVWRRQGVSHGVGASYRGCDGYHSRRFRINGRDTKQRPAPLRC